MIVDAQAPTGDPVAAELDALKATGLLDDIENEADEEDTTDAETEDQDTDSDDANDDDSSTEEAPDSDEDADESDEDADEQPAGRSKAPKTFTVEVDGKDVVVPAEERARGYLRDADYTQKLQTHGENVRTFEAEKKAFDTELKPLLEQLKAQINGELGEEPDWETLKNEDPIGYAVQKEERREKIAKREAVDAEIKRINDDAAQKHQAAVNTYLTEQAVKLNEAVPEWKDEKVRTREQKMLREYATAVGFSAEEASQVYDHRLVLVLRDAARYRALKQTGKEKLRPAAPKTKTSAPGRGEDIKHQPKAKIMRRLEQSGSLEDGLAALKANGLV